MPPLSALALLLAAAAARAQLITTSYTCSLLQVASCAAEREACLAAPRPWTRGFDAAFTCGCWAQSYLCYQDCSASFPPDFAAQCLAVCGRSVCSPEPDSVRP
jgi:hypothetical protein